MSAIRLMKANQWFHSSLPIIYRNTLSHFPDKKTEKVQLIHKS